MLKSACKQLLFCHIVKTCYFGNFENAWPSSNKIILSIYINFSCLPACKKINFLIHFFLKTLQRNSKLFILGNLGMSDHTHQKWQYHFEETFDTYQQEKINSILYVFLEVLQRYYKVVSLGALVMPGHAHPKWSYQFVENFCVYLQVKNQFHSPCFSGDTAKICKLI